MDYAQTKERRDDCPWCGGDIDALGLGAAMHDARGRLRSAPRLADFSGQL